VRIRDAFVRRPDNTLSHLRLGREGVQTSP
jgi:hypothetical protein